MNNDQTGGNFEESRGQLLELIEGQIHGSQIPQFRENVPGEFFDVIFVQSPAMRTRESCDKRFDKMRSMGLTNITNYLGSRTTSRGDSPVGYQIGRSRLGVIVNGRRSC